MHMTTQCCCATAFDGRHGLELPQANSPLMGSAVRAPMVADNIRNLK